LYARYDASNYNASTNIWKDSSPNHNDVSFSSTSGLTIETISNHGKTFKVIHGAVNTQISFYRGYMAQYTLFHVARYTGQGSKGRIFASDFGYWYSNWLSGFWASNAGIAYHHDDCGWITPYVDSFGNSWIVSSDTSGRYRGNGATLGANGCTYPLVSLAINKWGNEYSDFMVVDVILFNTELPLSSVVAIENALMARYGICAVGQYIGVDGSCIQCPIGYYCVSVSKVGCPQGYSTASMGSSSSSQCSICATGYYMSGSTCVACTIGYSTVSTGSTSSSQCSICASGYYTSGSGTSVACTSGYSTASTGSSSSSQCSVCAIGYYASGGGCTACPSDMTTLSAGATSVSMCGKMILKDAISLQ